MEENKNCPLYDTKYCDMLNMEGCEGCTLGAKGEAELLQLKKNLEITDSLMPEEGIYGLFSGETCVLCKGPEKGKRSHYAVCDIGNAEPACERHNALGVKTIARTGSLVPVQMSCCAACRKRILKAEYVPVLVPTLLGVAALILLSIHAVWESLAALAPVLPFVIFIAVIGFGFILGRCLRKKYFREYGKLTYMNIFQLPQMAGMKDRGWFELNPSKHGMSRMIFSKDRLKRGLYTGPVGRKGEAAGIPQ